VVTGEVIGVRGGFGEEQWMGGLTRCDPVRLFIKAAQTWEHRMARNDPVHLLLAVIYHRLVKAAQTTGSDSFGHCIGRTVVTAYSNFPICLFHSVFST
jgi:hypothetical protein